MKVLLSDKDAKVEILKFSGAIAALGTNKIVGNSSVGTDKIRSARKFDYVRILEGDREETIEDISTLNNCDLSLDVNSAGDFYIVRQLGQEAHSTLVATRISGVLRDDINNLVESWEIGKGLLKKFRLLCYFLTLMSIVAIVIVIGWATTPIVIYAIWKIGTSIKVLDNLLRIANREALTKYISM